ncbi:MAG: peptidylprolyl isomerase [Alicyclobacillaceae bacterium]|uniref:SurA N-terminal domain-containing protein n=1 Tax=Alicyclobacillus sp. SP_1 TaxID=2942475 RepID=UPI002157702A|nr:peptidylprolyl isomerase [Alicyclobacillus sp. SP_1]MCY0894842.1 peptidylprolyl isomerase [Alicyclobacillaceae bacterium]
MSSFFQNIWVTGGIGVVVGALIVGGIWDVHAQSGGASSGIVAKVGSTTISASDFSKRVEKLSGQQTLEQMISDDLIQDGAKEYGLTASKKELAGALQSFEQQNNVTNSSALSNLLSQNGMTMADLQDTLKMDVLEQKLAERNVTVTKAEVEAYYKQNASQFKMSTGKVAPLKTVEPLIEEELKQSKAMTPQQLFASLAKKYPVTVVDTKYSGVKQAILG